MYTNAIKKANHCIMDATERYITLRRNANDGFYLVTLIDYAVVTGNNTLTDYAAAKLSLFTKKFGTQCNINSLNFASAALLLKQARGDKFDAMTLNAQAMINSLLTTKPALRNGNTLALAIKKYLPHLLRIDDLVGIAGFAARYAHTQNDTALLDATIAKAEMYLSVLDTAQDGIIATSYNTRTSRAVPATNRLYSATGYMLYVMSVLHSVDSIAFERSALGKRLPDLFTALRRARGADKYLPLVTGDDRRRDTLATLLWCGSEMYFYRSGLVTATDYAVAESTFFEVIDDLKLRDDLLSLQGIGSIPRIMQYLPVNLLALTTMGSDIAEGLAAFMYAATNFYILNKSKIIDYDSEDEE